MDQRERIIRSLTFKDVDRIPLLPGHGRKSTREKWYTQGLPPAIRDINEYAYFKAGGKFDWPASGEGFPVNERMIPLFEEKVLEKKERSQIVQDWKGNICEISNEYSVASLRNAVDFVTRRWLKCPVETRADWIAMKKRYDPRNPSRFPERPAELGRQLAGRDWFLEVVFPGPFWQLREWLGFERLCMLFYDDPEWVGEMIGFWEGYITALLKKLFTFIIPDSIHISEDNGI